MARPKDSGARAKHGLCALTRRPGKLVKSHIIPEALTKPTTAGSPLIQHGMGTMPSQRWSSWYDPELVTSEGEMVLSDLDDWGIRELRRLKLVWSGWQQQDELDLRWEYHVPWQWIATRRIRPSDAKRLRRFFHSLLWRAAATRKPEFSSVAFGAQVMEHLRRVVLGEVEAPELFLPMYLVQHSTKGPMHNWTPFNSVLTEKNSSDVLPDLVYIHTLRFYFDGLVAHFVTSIPDGFQVDDLKKTLIGCNEVLTLATIPYEDSAERLNFEAVVRDYNQLKAKAAKARRRG